MATVNHTKDYRLSVLGYTALGGLVYGVGSGFAMAGLTGPPSSYFIMGITGLSINLYHISTDENNIIAMSHNF